MLTRIPEGLGNPAQLLPEHKPFLAMACGKLTLQKELPADSLPCGPVGVHRHFTRVPWAVEGDADQAYEATAEGVHRGGQDGFKE